MKNVIAYATLTMMGAVAMINVALAVGVIVLLIV